MVATTGDWWVRRDKQAEVCNCCGTRPARKAGNNSNGLVYYPALQWFLCVGCQLRYTRARRGVARQRREQVLVVHTAKNEAEGHGARTLTL